MTLYEIDRRFSELIESGTDPETGELTIDPAKLEAVQMERQTKVENLALYIKNLTAEAEMVKAEAAKLTERKRALEAKAERMKNLLDYALAGEKFWSPRCEVSFRSSESVEIDENRFWAWAADHPAFTRRKDPEPDKVMIKNALKAGMQVDGAEIVKKRSVVIK